MKRFFSVLLIGLVTILFASAQDLYMPLDFQKAFKNGTRSIDGSVTEKYWQNTANYKIRASIRPEQRMLEADADITYYNNSPDTLDQIVFHAYHDYYKPGAQRAGFFSDSDAEMLATEGMVIQKVLVAGKERDLSDRQNARYSGTNYSLRLDDPLYPGDSVQLSIDWKYEIPGEGFERSGAIDSTSYFIAYWYPEIAVYDDIFGWDRILYDASAEFYHDVTDYEVEITVPGNYLVWASVAPSNGDEVYPASILKKIKKASKSADKTVIVSAEDIKNGIKMKSNTWKFSARNFPDFSFALSDHFVWESATYEDEFGQYTLNSAYPPENEPFSTVLDAQKEALRIFHNEFPVYEFPYHYFTIFNGLQGGGMEFAGMANDQVNSGERYSRYTGKEVTDYEANLGLTVHEMCHMYFPFLMGINEKRYAWMDEGWASFSSYFIPSIFTSYSDKPYLGSSTVLPVMTPTYTTPSHSSINSYTIGAYSYHALYHLLGEDFTPSLQAYMDTWKNKHPTPYDFFNSIETAYGKDLNWFWDAWYFQWGYVDIAIKEYDNNVLLVENKGGRPVAFEVNYTYDDGSSLSEQISPAVWESSAIASVPVDSGKNVVKIQLTVMDKGDAVADNNVWEER